MLNTKFATLAWIAPALALWSCRVPKAIVIEAAPPTKLNQSATPTSPTDPAFPGQPDNGFRMPDMLAMPDEGEFRATAPPAPKSGSNPGAVISRPPTDPPPRPKPKEAGKE